MGDAVRSEFCLRMLSRVPSACKGMRYHNKEHLYTKVLCNRSIICCLLWINIYKFLSASVLSCQCMQLQIVAAFWRLRCVCVCARTHHVMTCICVTYLNTSSHYKFICESSFCTSINLINLCKSLMF